MRKLLALLLTLAMVLSLASVAVVATEDLGTPIDNDFDWTTLEANEKYYLTEDIVIEDGAAQIVFKPGMTLDGQGHAFLIADDYTWTAAEPFVFEDVEYTTPTVLKNVTFGKADDKIELCDVQTAVSGSDKFNTPLFNPTSSKYKINWENVDFYVSKAASSAGITYTFPIFWNCSGTQNFTDCDVYSNIVAEGNCSLFMMNCGGTVTFTNCTLNGSLSGGTATGGWIKEASGVISFVNCVNNANVASKSTTTGGYIHTATTAATISFVGCSYTGDITGYGHTGGFIGNVLNIPAEKLSVKNCTVTAESNIDHVSGGWAGGFFGDIAPRAYVFEGLTFAGTIRAQRNTGGIVGRVAADKTAWTDAEEVQTYIRCKNLGTVESKLTANGKRNSYSSGGIVGINPGGPVKMIGCSNQGTVGGAGDRIAGGLLGLSDNNAKGTNEFINCSNHGTITSTSTAAAGILGYAQDPAIFTNCVNYADITSAKSVGGMVGVTSNRAPSFIFTNCVNYGDITSTEEVAAGLFAYGALVKEALKDKGIFTMTDCANYGNISGVHNVGGLAGSVGATVSVTLTGCVNMGTLTLNSSNSERVAGLIARLDSTAATVTISNCANLVGMTGTTKAQNANGYYADAVGHFIAGAAAGATNTFDMTTDISLTNCFGIGDVEVANTAVVKGTWVAAVADDPNTLEDETVAAHVEYAAEDLEDDGVTPKALAGAANDGMLGGIFTGQYTATGCKVTGVTVADLNAADICVDFLMDGGKIVVATPEIRGYQMSNDGKAIRILAAINSTEYGANGKVGFTYTVKIDGNTVINNKTNTVGYVMERVNAVENGVNSEVLAEDLYATYLSAITFKGIPAEGNVVITIKAVAEYDGDNDAATANTTMAGTEYVLTFANGVLVSTALA